MLNCLQLIAIYFLRVINYARFYFLPLIPVITETEWAYSAGSSNTFYIFRHALIISYLNYFSLCCMEKVEQVSLPLKKRWYSYFVTTTQQPVINAVF